MSPPIFTWASPLPACTPWSRWGSLSCLREQEFARPFLMHENENVLEKAALANVDCARSFSPNLTSAARMKLQWRGFVELQTTLEAIERALVSEADYPLH